MGITSNKELCKLYSPANVQYETDISSRTFTNVSKIKLRGTAKILLKKKLNPLYLQMYTSLSSISEFVESSQAYFTMFQFLKKADGTTENYDLFFDFGEPSSALISESSFLQSFGLILDSLVFLESQSVYYPAFEKEFLMKVDNEFRLVHPLCSDFFLENFLNQITWSPTDKQNNYREFISMSLSLLLNGDYKIHFFSSHQNRELINTLQQNLSDSLAKFFVELVSSSFIQGYSQIKSIFNVCLMAKKTERY